MTQKIWRLAAALILLTGLCLTGGCGKKGPPLPPLGNGNVIAPPTKLAYTVDGSRVTLTWTHQVDPDQAKIPADAFEVFAATRDEQGCQGCPFIFKSAGTVPVPQKTFTYEMKPGLKYYFRIQASGPDGMKSRLSKTLNIEFEKD